ncbi:MAG TPA: hypothetical protein DEO94_06135 [Cyanobacteria bacterium UBA11991]|nr:hypothetical protein [Cyanobacteriota bacterium]MDY6358984.1 hypothetical protein [Cyanobacteriota bacterium]MDY6364270.1 hypothetical protein [Cyanobacteriota bacterium]MDY6382727.1 hypothetical protein [Cyanobacteriota bacterium]HCB11692.1 hypothetical protein [Cyanobacteria bacterium UBA11991]
MLVDSAGYIKNSSVIAGVDTNKVQAKPVIKKVSNDFKYNSFTNNPQPEKAEPTAEKSVVGRFLNIFA